MLAKEDCKCRRIVLVGWVPELTNESKKIDGWIEIAGPCMDDLLCASQYSRDKISVY